MFFATFFKTSGKTPLSNAPSKTSSTSERLYATNPIPAKSIISGKSYRNKNISVMKTLCLLSYPKRYGSRHNFLLQARPKQNVRASSGKSFHRYAELIKKSEHNLCSDLIWCKGWDLNPHIIADTRT